MEKLERNNDFDIGPKANLQVKGKVWNYFM